MRLRGDSAGFVHVECLEKLAMSEEVSGDSDAVFYGSGWLKCGNCKQGFRGAHEMDMMRRFWRRHRSSQDLDGRYEATRSLALCLGMNCEFAANQLLDEASNYVGSTEDLLDLKLLRAEMLKMKGQNLAALELLQAILPEAKVYTANPWLYCRAMQKKVDVLLILGRYQEGHELVTELVAVAKAKLGLEDPRTLTAMTRYALVCHRLGSMEECKANFEDVLTTQTRVFGREHPSTQQTRGLIRACFFPEPSG